MGGRLAHVGVWYGVVGGGAVEKRYDVFLAFGGADRDAATEVRRRLAAIGWAAFSDADLPPGAEWVDELGKAMDQARSIVLLKPRQDKNSPWLKHERVHAINASAAGRSLFLPFRAEGAPACGVEDYGTEQFVWAKWRDDDARATALAVDAALRHPWHRAWFPVVPPAPTAEPGAVPLRAHLHLDRVWQWSKLRDLCLQPRPGCFVVHGAPGQHLDGFLERVRKHLSEDVSNHEVVVVSTDGLFHGDVSVEGWQGRVMGALGCKDPVVELRSRSKRRSVMLSIGSLAVRPARFTAAHERSWQAFLAWVEHHLPELLTAARPRTLRVLLAVEEADGGPWSGRLEAAFVACLTSLGHSPARIKRVEHPSFDDVRDYVELQGLLPTEAWWDALRVVYDQIAVGSRDYRELSDEIEALVEQLPKRGG